MSKYVGRLVNLGVARETTRGTFVAPTFEVPWVSMSFDDKIVQARSSAALSNLADSEEAFVTTRYGQGEVSGEIRDRSFGLFLYAMLGSLSTAGPTDSAYTHSFTLSQTNQHQSLSFLVDDGNTDEAYKLVMLDELRIISELDQVVRYEAGFMSKKGHGSTATMPAVAAENKFTKKHLVFKVASSVGGLAGASAISVKSLSLTISKNTMLDDVLGTAEPEDILNQQIAIEGQATLTYNDETYKTLFTDGTSRAMRIEFTNTDATIGASTRPALIMQFPKVDFFTWEPDYSLNEIVTQTLSFKMSQDVTNALQLISTCQLVNTQASY